MKPTVLYSIIVTILLLNLTVFSQERKDFPCTYQAPLISCEQAQENANAIYKYPIALYSLAQKDSLIKLKESELKNVRLGFFQQQKILELDKVILEKKARKEERFKRWWRRGTVVSLAIILIKSTFK